MGDNHPLDGAALHRPDEQLLPGVCCRLVAHTGVDDGPAVAVLGELRSPTEHLPDLVLRGLASLAAATT